MPHLLPLLLSLLSFQELPPALTAYREACAGLAAAIDKCDKYALYDAQEKLEDIVTDDFYIIEPADSATLHNSERPLVMFTPEFADIFIAQSFQLTELDDPALMRGRNNATILIHHAAIAPGATLSWKSSAYDFCAMFIAPYPQDAELSLTVTDLNNLKKYQTATKSGPSDILTWQMDTTITTSPNFTFSVTNHSDKKVSFVVAMN